MGNRGAIKALLRLAEKRENGKVREIVLAAPDVDSMLFDKDFAKPLCQSYPRVTVYASDKDRALWSSDALSHVARVGEIRNGNPTILARANLNIIDASNVETSFLNHSYFGDATSVISDIFQLVRNKDAAPNVRSNTIQKKNGANGEFWYFRK